MIKKYIKFFLVFIIYLFTGCSSTNQTGTLMPGQQPQQFSKTITKTVGYKYLLYLPKDYFNRKKQWPMILFLHGSGERGDNLETVKIHGVPKIIEGRDNFPFIVVSPQCPQGERWSNGWAIETLNALLDEIIKNYSIDTNRIYLTGLSMGGFGTWSLAEEYPERFAAIAPVCGGGDPEKAYKIRRIPVWVFHGAKDNVVPIRNAEVMVDALKKYEGDVKYTVYPDAGHDSWTETYNNPKLYDWFLEHTKQTKKLLKIENDNIQASSGDVFKAFDGDFNTRWESEWKDPQWITINFKKLQKVNQIVILWETAFGKEYEILASNDNVNWRSVYKETNGDGCADKISFNSLDTQYLKFNFIQRGTEWGYSIWDMEIE